MDVHQWSPVVCTLLVLALGTQWLQIARFLIQENDRSCKIGQVLERHTEVENGFDRILATVRSYYGKEHSFNPVKGLKAEKNRALLDPPGQALVKDLRALMWQRGMQDLFQVRFDANLLLETEIEQKGQALVDFSSYTAYVASIAERYVAKVLHFLSTY